MNNINVTSCALAHIYCFIKYIVPIVNTNDIILFLASFTFTAYSSIPKIDASIIVEI